MDEKKYQSEDFITISGVRKGIRTALRHFFWLLSYLRFVILKSWRIIAISIVSCLLLGYLYYISKPAFYKASMEVVFNELTKKTYADMLDQLNELGTIDMSKGLSSELKIPQSITSQVLFIDSRNMNNEPLKSDTSTKVEQPFKIIVGLKDNIPTGVLQNAIVNYINNSPYLQRLKEEQKKIYQEKIIFIDGELKKLDSLKSAYIKFLATPNVSATFYNNAFNPADLYVQSALLANQKDITTRWLALSTSGVYVIDSLKITNATHSRSLTNVLILLVAAGLLIGFLVGFIKETRKKVIGNNPFKF
jgi:hypothetical protein